ncbi:MAG: hypothetical protein M3R01_13155, partial [Actinomycetota bacterium]|nr:hypothetical protein [Actinomycetota bacterium]
AGMAFEVVRPFEELNVSYRGKVVLLDDPLAMAEPRTAFAENPYAECEVDLTYRRVSDMFGGEPDTPHERPGEEFARGHYEQLVAGAGTVRVGEDTWTVDGFGLRDHSWGPRFWQAPWYYRWLTGNAGPDFGFMASRVARRDSDDTRGGFVWDEGRLHLCRSVEVRTEWTGEDSYHRAVEAVLTSSERQWRVRGRVLSLIPLRNRRTGPDGDAMVTRISEGMTEWTLEDGRTGYGLSEYLDQLVDGAPVGVAE